MYPRRPLSPRPPMMMMISNAVCLSVRLSICLPSCPSSLFFPSIAERDELYVVGKAASQSRKKLAEFAKEREREGRKEGVLYGDHSSN